MTDTPDIPAISLPAGAFDFDAVNAAAREVQQGRPMTPELAMEISAAVARTAAVPIAEPAAADEAESVPPEKPRSRGKSRDAQNDAPEAAVGGVAANQE
jgi:hypothetical protein